MHNQLSRGRLPNTTKTDEWGGPRIEHWPSIDSNFEKVDASMSKLVTLSSKTKIEKQGVSKLSSHLAGGRPVDKLFSTSATRPQLN
jgi:hypothetical protein